MERHVFFNNKRIVVIFVLAFLVRLMLFIVIFQHPERSLREDSASYLTPAINMMEGHGFSGNNQPPFHPTAIRTIGYPFFIALIYSVFGHNILVIVFIQILMDAVIAVLTYYFGLKLMPEQAALFGAACYVFSLEPILSSVFILTETLFSLFLLIAIFLLVSQKINKKRIASSGVLIGISILIRPITSFFPIAALFLIWMTHRNNWKEFVKNGIVFSLSVMVVLFPWVFRNYKTMGVMTISTISSYSLLFYNAAALRADLEGVSPLQAKAAIEKEVEKELADRGWTGRETLEVQLYNELGKKYLLSSPLRYIYIHLKQDINFFLPDVTSLLEVLGYTNGNRGTLSVLNSKGIYAAIKHYFNDNIFLLYFLLPFIIFLALLYAASFISILSLLARKKWYQLSFLMIPVCYLMVLPGPASVARFRVPAMPYLCLAAGLGVVIILRKKHLLLTSFGADV